MTSSEPAPRAPTASAASGDSASRAAGVLLARLALPLILALALALRLRGLRTWWLNPDEGIYYSLLTRADFADFWAEVAANAHPPLYYLLLRALGTVSWDFLWLRSFSVVCGVAAVAGVWAVARELATPPDRASVPDPWAKPDLRAEVAAGCAALLLAVSPAAIQLSQVMRPYMLQVALLTGALHLLLRHLRDHEGRALVGYVVLASLAVLTHYSSALALVAFSPLVLVAARAQGGGRAALRARSWRMLAAAVAAPGAVAIALYLGHVRGLSGSDLADEALNGWLSFYMIDAPLDAWLGYLGVQALVADPWLRGATALLALGAAGAAARAGDLRTSTLVASALGVAVLTAAAGAYPFGATRHSAWLLVVLLPAVGWAVGAAVEGASLREAAAEGTVMEETASEAATTQGARTRRGRLAAALVFVLLAGSGPIGLALGLADAPWAPTEHVLRRADLTHMVDVLDPTGEPRTIAMSAQTFYLLLPFWAAERESATFSPDGGLFHFAYGERDVLVTQAWDFTLGGDRAAPGHLAAVLASARSAFPALDLHEREDLVLLVGGWRPPFVDELDALALQAPFGRTRRNVPGLYAFVTELPVLLDVLGVKPRGSGAGAGASMASGGSSAQNAPGSRR